jgi:hypothetical protein
MLTINNACNCQHIATMQSWNQCIFMTCCHLFQRFLINLNLRELTSCCTSLLLDVIWIGFCGIKQITTIGASISMCQLFQFLGLSHLNVQDFEFHWRLSLWKNHVCEDHIAMQLISSKQLMCNYITMTSWKYEKK